MRFFFRLIEGIVSMNLLSGSLCSFDILIAAYLAHLIIKLVELLVQ